MISIEKPLVIKKIFYRPMAQVWKAISHHHDMQQWYFEMEDFIPEVGFQFQFNAYVDRDNEYTHLCEVTEVVEGKRLCYSWRYEGYEGSSLVKFELFDDGSDTLLKLTHTGLESFPQDNPNFSKASFEKGWTFIIGTSLKKYLELSN